MWFLIWQVKNKVVREVIEFVKGNPLLFDQILQENISDVDELTMEQMNLVVGMLSKVLTIGHEFNFLCNVRRYFCGNIAYIILTSNGLPLGETISTPFPFLCSTGIIMDFDLSILPSMFYIIWHACLGNFVLFEKCRSLKRKSI